MKVTFKTEITFAKTHLRFELHVESYSGEIHAQVSLTRKKKEKLRGSLIIEVHITVDRHAVE